MSGAGAQRLYTPRVLGLAVSLVDYPFDATAALLGEARSPTCGSSIAISLTNGADGTVSTLGLRVTACAIGQAAAAIFARKATGKNSDNLERASREISRWLADQAAARPDWPGIDALDQARAYPARHGAILLPWKAALAALSKESQSG